MNYLTGKFSRIFQIAMLLFAFIFVFQQSSTAQQTQGATLGGYGELHYNNVTYNANGEQTPGQLDFHRFVLFAGYNFNDWISFRSELEVEHTLLEAEDGKAEGGEVALEQAYMDLRFKRQLGLRAGLILVPVGIVNLTHEPPTFNGVERPNVEKYLIPSTWRESGIGIYGSTQSGLSYQAYAMAGLKPNGITGDEGIREARQEGFESSTANLAFSGRLDYQAGLNLKVGASYYVSSLSSEIEDGNAEKISSLDGALFNLVEGHVLYQKNRFEARGLLVYSGLSKAQNINTEFNNSAGNTQFGGYVELGYNILPFFAPTTEQKLTAFGRYENYDTQFTTSAVFDNPENNRNDYTFGLTYKPASQVAFKADYQFLTSAGSKDIQQLNLGIGYNF